MADRAISDARSARARAGTAVTVCDTHLLLARVVEQAEDLPFQVGSRPMMGGPAAYSDGRTFVPLSTAGSRTKLLPGGQEGALLDLVPHGPPRPGSKSYVTFSEPDRVNEELIVDWLILAARRAPATKRRQPPLRPRQGTTKPRADASVRGGCLGRPLQSQGGP